MKNLTKITLAIFISINFFSCENPNLKFGQLPTITTEGKGTFGYVVDGEVQGQCYDGLFTSLATAQIAGDTTFLVSESCNSHTFGLAILNDRFASNNSYDLIDSLAYIRYSPPGGPTFISNGDENSNAVVELLIIDSLKNIVSGTFKGTLFNEDGQSVEITDGRFDLIYSEY